MNETKQNQAKSSFDTFLGLWQQLNHNQRRYVVIAGEYKTKKDAAEALGLKPQTIHSWPPIVDTAVRLHQDQQIEAARAILHEAVSKAAMVKIAALDSDDNKTRQDAASEVLDRILGKPTQHQEVNVKSYRLVDDTSGNTH